MTGPSPFISKLMGVFMDFDKMVGKEARKEAEELAKDLQSDDPAKQEAAKKKFEEMRKRGGGGSPPLNAAIKGDPKK